VTPEQFNEHLTHFQMTWTAASLYFKVSMRTINRYSTGETEIPRAVELVLKTARALDLSLSDFAKISGSMA
jgi:hypothetical protein